MESLLDKIDQPSDLKKLNAQQVEKLCAEIRHFMLENISKTGGHLASNLGTVELTVALHRVLETPKDKIVFDVGHQCYTHKLLTGRRKQFDHLRQLDGISGFPNPNESVHDAFIAGHGNTALSLAIGMAWAKKIKHEPGLVVALIGDGAFTGGMVYEGMNNIEQLDNLLVILNDNKMSISKNVGALARYLTHLRTTTAYFDAKDNVRSFLDGVPLVGAPLKKNITECKTLLRRAMYHSTMFEDMGFQYIGPVDGHNVEELERTLRTIRNRQGPHFLHVITKKGKGYQPAEMNPGNYHGVSAFDPDGMPDPEVAPKESFSTVFGKLLVQEGTQNPKLCAITAAMKYGTGLQFFAHRHPQRFFDVGIAEQHAVTFASGLAKNGMIPVFAVYSTFLQRSYDQLIHDVAMQDLKVIFGIDRAGFVGEDGESHQGVFDVSFLNSVPGLSVYAPADYEETAVMFVRAIYNDKGAVAVRYPRGQAGVMPKDYYYDKTDYSVFGDEGSKNCIVTYGREFSQCWQAYEKLHNTCLIKINKIKPLPKAAVIIAAKSKNVFFFEESVKTGGIGEIFGCELEMFGADVNYRLIAVEDEFIKQASVDSQLKKYHLDCNSVLNEVNNE